jgi:integrase
MVERQRRVTKKGEEATMTRRTFQQGYVSNPIRTRNGIAFKIRYRVPAPGGKWKHRSETLHGLRGKKAARAVLEERIKNSATSFVSNDMTLQVFVDTFWKPYLDRKNLKPATRSGYQSVLDYHLFPDLGDVPLSGITPLHIENLVRKKETQKLSPKSIRNILVVFQGIFNVALDNDLIQRSPIRKSHRPECKRFEKTAWTADQLKLILENVLPEHGCLFTCIALTGLRLGELLALQWKHMDFDAGVIKVEQSLWRGQVVAPKTIGSARTVPYGAVLGEILANHKQRSPHNQAVDFVFCKPDGDFLNPDVLRKDVLYPILDRLHIPRPKRSAGFHAFRHSAASLINNRTGNLKLAQNLLGHANLSTTADIYTHTSTEVQREASEILEQTVFGNLFPICSQKGTGTVQ